MSSRFTNSNDRSDPGVTIHILMFTYNSDIHRLCTRTYRDEYVTEGNVNSEEIWVLRRGGKRKPSGVELLN